jgi:hypothetical protein
MELLGVSGKAPISAFEVGDPRATGVCRGAGMCCATHVGSMHDCNAWRREGHS